VPFTFWKQAIDSLQKIPNRELILLAEGARNDHFSAGFQINFGWSFYDKNVNVFKNGQSAAGLFTTHQSEYSAIPAGSLKLRFTSNHDKCAWEDTPIGAFGGKNASMAAFVITAYLGGVTLIYDGQEVGCPVKLPFFSRSPINWTTNPDMFQAYKQIMGIRAAHPALRTGTLEYFSTTDIAAFKRAAGTDEVLVLVNTRNGTKTFNVPANLQNTGWVDGISGAAVNLGSSLSLNAFEYRILVK
jgi:glycosidase